MNDHDKELQSLAELIRRRNEIDTEIASLIGRPALNGHIGEWIASRVFDIQLEASASARGYDGRFRSGPLADKTVNVKFYAKREGVLDTNEHPHLDYYLVLTGPKAAAVSSIGTTRPPCIANVYLFDARQVRADQVKRGIKSGTGASVRAALWEGAEIYPQPSHSVLALTVAQRSALALFSPQG